MGQKLGPHDETELHRKARERWEFYGRVRTCCLHRRVLFASTEEEP